MDYSPQQRFDLFTMMSYDAISKMATVDTLYGQNPENWRTSIKLNI